MGQSVLIVSNPASGAGAATVAAARAAERLAEAGYSVEKLESARVEELRSQLRSRLELPLHALIIVGGDGMVSLAINALRGRDIPLGIVPSGTGNDFVRGLGPGADRVESAITGILAALAEGGTAIDLGEVSGAHGDLLFAGSLNAGFDALVNARANALRWPRGSLRYVVAVLLELVHLSPRTYQLRHSGRTWKVRAHLLAVANNGYIGGGMNIVPDASLTDGQLELFAVAPLPRLRFLLIFGTVFRGTHVRRREVSITAVTEIHLSGSDIIAYADGEPVGALPLRVRVKPGAQRILWNRVPGA